MKQNCFRSNYILIKTTNVNLNEIFTNTELQKLSFKESNLIEGPLTYKETSLILKTMSNNRSPGSDGFDAEFVF